MAQVAPNGPESLPLRPKIWANSCHKTKPALCEGKAALLDRAPQFQECDKHSALDTGLACLVQHGLLGPGFRNEARQILDEVR